MTKSPFLMAQPEYVTKEDFDKSDEYMRDGFKTVLHNIECVDQNVIKVQSQITELRTEMRQSFKDVRGELESTRKELKNELESAKKEFKNELESTKNEFKKELESTKKEILGEFAKTSAGLLSAIKSIK